MKLLLSLLPLCLIANPTGSQVTSGDANFLLEGKQLAIEASDKTIIEWQDFSIGLNECTRFIQPTADSAVLNRVVTQIPSSILGSLEANGQVFLINPNGIIFGKDCCINTGQFIASTLDLKDEAFLNGDELLFESDKMAKIQHLGKITAKDGDIFLIAPEIEHSGEDRANSETLLSGAKVVFQPRGEKRISIQAPMPEGDIENAYALAINLTPNSQIHTEKSISIQAEEGKVSAGGSLTSPGGEIHLLAKEIQIGEKGHISVSSKNDAGSIYIGGGYQGCDPKLYVSEITHVPFGSVIEANSIEAGDGGKIIIWSDGITHFEGLVEARGGSKYGDGGFIEVSGKGFLHFDGKASTLAPMGQTGTLLLDPSDIEIVSNGGIDVSVAGAPNYVGTAATCIIDNTNLAGVLGGNNVIVSTASGFAAPFGGRIRVIDDVIWAAPTSLTLNATTTINVFANVSNAASTGITLNAGDVIVIGDSSNIILAALDTGGNAPIDITSTGNSIVMKGGMAGPANAIVRGSVVTITTPMDFLMAGGSGPTANATVASNAGLNLNVGNNMVMQGGQSTGVTPPFTSGGDAHIRLAGTVDNFINVSGSVRLLGGIGVGSNQAEIHKVGPADLFMNVGGNMWQYGSPTGGTTYAKITGTSFGGTINLSVNNDYYMQGFGPFKSSWIQGFLSPINVQVGQMMLMTDAEIFSTAGVAINVGDTFEMFSGLGSDGLVCRVESSFSTVFIQAENNIIMTGSDSTLLFPSPRIVPNVQGDIIAGNDFLINDFSGIFSQKGGAVINLVCDNDFPSPPSLGLGSFQAVQSATLGNLSLNPVSGAPDTMRIFTSRRTQNSILTTINNAPFLPGPYLVDVANERWCIWYFDPYYSPQFVIFYKECQEILEALAPNQDFAEFFRDIRPYNEYIYLANQFNVYYEREKRNLSRTAMDSFDLFDLNSYFIRRRSYRFNNINNQISPTAYTVSERPLHFD